MSHNNSICKFRNYSRDSSLAAHDFSTKFRRHLFYRGQPSPAFRDAESVRRQLSRGGRQTAAQRRGWGAEVRRADADGGTEAGMLAEAQRGVRATAQRAATDDGTERCAGGVRRTDADGNTEVGMQAEARRADADGGTEAGIVAGAQRRNADGWGRGAAAGRPPRVIDSKAGDSVLNFLPFL